MSGLNMKNVQLCLGLMMLISMLSFSCAFTDPRDVFAINSLHAALGSPALPGWVPLGGDPCLEDWQGVTCVVSNITGILLRDANLGGELGTNMDKFTSIISIDLSGNHIGGTIPANLPPTMKTFFINDNQFTGSIPDLSQISQLTDLSLGNNNLTGEVPDSFQLMTGLINLDLSGNRLSGPLPPSMGNMSSLTTLLLQNNTLTGALDVLQDLPLVNLNIENNQFSGPVPPKLLTIPNFRSTGNPLNTTALPPSPSASPSLSPNVPVPGEPSSQEIPGQPSASDTSNPTKSSKYRTARWTILGAAVVVFILIVVVLGLWFCMVRYCKRRQGDEEYAKGHVKTIEGKDEKSKISGSFPQKFSQANNEFKETSIKVPDVVNIDDKKVKVVKEAAPTALSRKTPSVDLTGINLGPLSTQPVPPPRHYSSENIALQPVSEVTAKIGDISFPSSVKSYTVAALQEYSDSFSQENLVGEGMLGSVYRAELPDGKIVAVKKLNNAASKRLREDEFAQLISVISRIQHDNVIKLVGYCAEYGQRLIVSEFCNNATLYEAMHHDDEIHNKLSWNVRIKIALGAAKALEYMHEHCQPPVAHKNFKSSNILLDDKLEPVISDCGLAPLLPDDCTIQLSSGYGAPELELGTYTLQSDVFSFGVVMLELLTGRKPYDRSRPRGEQYLVRWAIPQLHDIDALSKMVDPSLKGSYPSKSLSRFADIISLCVQAEPEFRPPMSEMVENLLNMIQRES